MLGGNGMKNNHDQSNLRFDDTTSFADNCEAFLTRIEAIDSEMASILRNNWNALVAVVREGERDSKARGEFNTAIARELDALVAPDLQKDGA
jgi:hypothetical protein